MRNHPLETGTPLADPVSETCQLLIGTVHMLGSNDCEIRRQALSPLLSTTQQTVPSEIEFSRRGDRWSDAGIREFACRSSVSIVRDEPELGMGYFP